MHKASDRVYVYSRAQARLLPKLPRARLRLYTPDIQFDKVEPRASRQRWKREKAVGEIRPGANSCTRFIKFTFGGLINFTAALKFCPVGRAPAHVLAGFWNPSTISCYRQSFRVLRKRTLAWANNCFAQIKFNEILSSLASVFSFILGLFTFSREFEYIVCFWLNI